MPHFHRTLPPEQGKIPDLEVFYEHRNLPPGVISADWYGGPGWYWAVGRPGLTWTTSPLGPYRTMQEALSHARRLAVP